MKQLLILMLIGCYMFLVAADENPVAVTMKTKGTVSLSRINEDKTLSNGDLLHQQDKLVSSKDSFAAIRFVDGSSIVKLFPNSELIIKTEEKDGSLKKKNMLTRGKLFSKIEKKMGGYQVETPTVVASVKGTEFLVVVDEFGATTVYTFTGVVEMKNKSDQRSVILGPNEKGTSSGSGEIETGTFNNDEVDGYTSDEQEEKKTKRLQIELQDSDGTTKEVIIEVE